MPTPCPRLRIPSTPCPSRSKTNSAAALSPKSTANHAKWVLLKWVLPGFGHGLVFDEDEVIMFTVWVDWRDQEQEQKMGMGFPVMSDEINLLGVANLVKTRGNGDG
ncbi:hypothetical protein FH972_010776 [Carpinus fangiana]|uniref:Uncharacterized protein n=1 Tax=Carpinus fangiana TaxID=176857 RepID=A0A660KS80_9ROSI|nr:hypothetical protein FH972_010776 [Carpinus fangiana]